MIIEAPVLVALINFHWPSISPISSDQPKFSRGNMIQHKTANQLFAGGEYRGEDSGRRYLWEV